MIAAGAPRPRQPGRGGRFRHPIAAAVAAAGAALVAMVACDGTPVTTVAFRVEDPWAIAQGAMPLPLVVVGRAFAAAPPALVAEKVAVLMAEAITWNRGARFVLLPAAGAGQGLRVVLGFNGAAAGCGSIAAAAGGEPSAGQVRLRVMLCDGDRLLADVSGRVGGAAGPGDGRFRALIRQATGELLRPPPSPRP
jgi:hypothetical protein